MTEAERPDHVGSSESDMLTVGEADIVRLMPPPLTLREKVRCAVNVIIDAVGSGLWVIEGCERDKVSVVVAELRSVAEAVGGGLVSVDSTESLWVLQREALDEMDNVLVISSLHV